LITIKQIAEEHGVSRSSVHTYRRSSTFPQPVPAEGSTRIRYRADEVAAWFEANPKQQGKRTDLAPQQQGDPAMSAPARGGLTDQDYEDRELLLNTSDMIQRRWPDEYPTLVRDLRDLVDTINEEADA
jgi:predicted DNA-binding transcriptional regulator AlpA